MFHLKGIVLKLWYDYVNLSWNLIFVGVAHKVHTYKSMYVCNHPSGEDVLINCTVVTYIRQTSKRRRLGMGWLYRSDLCFLSICFERMYSSLVFNIHCLNINRYVSIISSCWPLVHKYRVSSSDRIFWLRISGKCAQLYDASFKYYYCHLQINRIINICISNVLN